MLQLSQIIKIDVKTAIKTVFDIDVDFSQILINSTKPEFEGDYTLVTFALAKILGKKPADIAEALGQALSKTNNYTSYNIIQGFLNLTLNEYLVKAILINYHTHGLVQAAQTGEKIMVEYSSPNTNKPLHFGHLRNIFLGASVSNILKANGHQVIKANLLNDRGIHICKSMYQWQQHGNGATPLTTGQKGDHLMGDYYVAFEQTMKAQSASLVEKMLANDFSFLNEEHKETATKLANALATSTEVDKQKDIKSKLSDIARGYTTYMQGARNLLIQWEEKEPETRKIWSMMNGWVVAGFDETYKAMGITFDKLYFESETYLLGKKLVEDGVQKGVLFKKEDGSIWIDLSADGLDEKLLLRGDGTSVYITQDIGTAQLKYDDHNGLNKSVYVIADEQNYHMQVLKLILQKIGEPCGDGIHHLSYGLVELPSGRMKTREGTVVDADDIIAEMIGVAKEQTNTLGKVDGFNKEELNTLYSAIGLGALKFFLLRVDPKKKMIFNPEESIDFQGFTGPFVQYTHARTCAILRKEAANANYNSTEPLLAEEKNLLLTLEHYTQALEQAGADFNPSLICNYLFSLAKQFNSFLAAHKIITAPTEDKKQLRLQICEMVKNTIANGLEILGITAPEKM